LNFDEIEKDVPEILARNLASTRKSAGYSQSKMAQILGVSLTQYKKYESGVEVLKIHMAQRWALRFGKPFFYLLQDSSYSLAPQDTGTGLSFKWNLANSLSDSYFLKLLDLVWLFSDQQPKEKPVIKRRITSEAVKEAFAELDNNTYITIARGIRGFRERFGISQDKMAELVDVSRSTYQQYEKENMQPRINILVAGRFLLATGISPLALLKGTKYAEVRYAQEERMALLWRALETLCPDKIKQFEPLISGFFNMTKTIRGAIVTDNNPLHTSQGQS
jgi:transcriptional regulator with XRE-family HTH domain